MVLDFFWLGLGLAAFGYFLGDGLKNFKNRSSTNIVQSMLEEENKNEFIKETDLHWYIGIRKEDAKKIN